MGSVAGNGAILLRDWHGTDFAQHHRQYINRRGEDDPRILNWQWGGRAAGKRRSSTEGDNA